MEEASGNEHTANNANPDVCQPSTSDCDPSVQMESLQEKTHRLIRMYADRISLAGLQDVRIAPRGMEKIFWTISLLACHLACIYLSGVSIMQYINDCQRKKTQTEVREVKSEVIPFPNVTVCSPSQVDMKTVAQRIIIPHDVEKYARGRFKSKDELIEAFLVYVAYSTNEKPQVEERDYVFMDKIWDASSKANGQSFSATFDQYYYNCSQIVQSCTFDGKPFECCEQAVKLFGDDLLCFTFKTDTKTQSPSMETNEKSGLEVDVMANWRDVPPTYIDMTDGFMVQVGNEYTPFTDAVGVPNGMQLTVRLTPTKNTQSFNCIGNTAKPPKLKYYSYYDPHGYNCYMEGFEDVIALGFVNCLVHISNFIPNESIICNSHQFRMLHDVMYGKYDNINIDMYHNNEITENRRLTWWRNVRSKLRKVFYSSQCQPFCTTWHYTMHIGYAALSPHPTTVHPHYSRSRIKVFFADTKYTQRVETPAFDLYTLFFKLGYLAGLYAGLSIVGFVELMAYGVVILRYWIIYIIKTREDKKVQKLQGGVKCKESGKMNTSKPYRKDVVKSIRLTR